MNISCIVDIASREVSFQENYRIASYDHNVDVIHFSVEPIEDFSLDLSSIKIAAQGPNKLRHDYAVDPSTVAIEEETGYITFDWPIPAGVTEMPIGSGFKYGDKGQLIFSVCAEIISGSTVSKAWHSDDGIITVVAHLEPEAGGGEDPSETATNAQKIGQLQTATAILQRKISGIASGTPPTANSTSEMDPDESTVYINTTDGNWYYWDGSAWQIGGVYGGAVTDTTLSISGAPADAKAVGDAIDDLTTDLTAVNTTITGNIKRVNLSDTYQSDQTNVLTSENDLNDCLTPNVYRASVGTLHAPTSNVNYHVIVFLSGWQNNTRKAITQIAISSANTQKMYVRTAFVNASNVVTWDNSGNWTQVNFDVSQIGNGVITRDKLSDYYQSNIPVMTSGDFNTILVASNVRVNAGVQNTPDTLTGWFIVTNTIPWTVEANPRRNLIQTAYKISDPTDVYYRVYDSGPKTFTEWASLYNRKNPLKGKKIVMMGDSTYAITGSNNGGHIAQILASLGDCTVYDCSFGGTRMSDSRGAGSSDTYKYFDFPVLVDAIISGDFTNQDNNLTGKDSTYPVNLATLKALDWSNVDILCIEFAANDFSGNVQIGDYTSNRETYTGAFLYCINALLTKYPTLQIVADGPRFRNWASAGTGYTAFNYKNNLDLLTKDYESALESVSAMHGIPMFKNLEHYGWNIYNWSHYFGTSEAHFNVNGTKYAAKALYSNLSALGCAQNL